MIFKSKLNPVESVRSGFISQLKSTSGFTLRSSAKSGDPLKPIGFFSLAVIESPIAEPCDEKAH